MADETTETQNNTRLVILELANKISIPMSLNAIVRLKVPNAIWQEHIANSSSKHKYSLAEIKKTLVTNGEGLSYVAYILQHHQDALVKAWPILHEAVVDPKEKLFVKASDELAYSHYRDKLEMNELMQKVMSGVSVSFMKMILEGHDGFKGVEHRNVMIIRMNRERRRKTNTSALF
uniref:Uncharacterized protein n=1 Tax=Nelumbo nucifera TaxID=4432 RepID=A0A822YTK6_NELNU|nr:TPA_asm: hypothetical protein HUJ06_006083 [Nelumbo nucifera]